MLTIPVGSIWVSKFHQSVLRYAEVCLIGEFCSMSIIRMLSNILYFLIKITHSTTFYHNEDKWGNLRFDFRNSANVSHFGMKVSMSFTVCFNYVIMIFHWYCHHHQTMPSIVYHTILTITNFGPFFVLCLFCSSSHTLFCSVVFKSIFQHICSMWYLLQDVRYSCLALLDQLHTT